MRESRYDLLCAIVLGLGQLCMLAGYDTQQAIVEPVLHSVHDREPSVIDKHAGYYGIALSFFVTNLANLAAPWALGVLGSKKALLLGSILFSLHMASFFYIHWIPFYATSALLGVGYGLFYTGHAGYTTEHSTKTTIERNSALTWALGTSCTIFGGILLLFTIKPQSETALEFNDELSKATDRIRSYREYSDSEIRFTYGALLGVTIVSNVIFAFMPTRPVKDSIASESDNKNRINFVPQMKRTMNSMKEKYMIQLIPLFAYIGWGGCIWTAVYPTSLMFSRNLAGQTYLPAYYSIAFGFGDVLMGFATGAVCKRVRNFAKLPLLIIGVASISLAMLLVLLSTPMWATARPTGRGTLLIDPNPYLPLLIGFLFGMGDNCVNTSRTVVCALILPEKRAEIFAISKFHQTLLEAAAMLLSPFISVYIHFGLMSAFGIASAILYRCVVNDDASKANAKDDNRTKHLNPICCNNFF